MHTQPLAGRRRARTAAVVVVGGSGSIFDFLSRSLRRHGEYELVEATLPIDVMRQLDRRPVPLVVCDAAAPGLSGFQLLGEIKARSPETHVVLMVPSGSAAQEQRARAAGADDYLSHAFALKRLVGILDEVLA